MQFRIFTCLWAVLALTVSARGELDTAGLFLPALSKQMILVVTKDWRAVDGRLQRFEMTSKGWQPIGPTINVVVGRNGLGWGRGVHPLPQPGPQKREGDGKSAAGIFELPYAFGYEPSDKVPGIKMPYVQCTSALECVDDTNSPHYNQILERSAVPAVDWKSSEKMHMTNGQYRLGIVVGHNMSPAAPGGGSCIFMHIWLGPGIGTSGCTAMREGDIESLLGWINIKTFPILVQLPQPEYERLQKLWRLPDMPTASP